MEENEAEKKIFFCRKYDNKKKFSSHSLSIKVNQKFYDDDIFLEYDNEKNNCSEQLTLPGMTWRLIF